MSRNISTGSLSASGGVTGSVGTFNGGLRSTDVYSHLVTGGGSYHATWTNIDGTIGYAPSSQRFKQDIHDAVLDAQAALAMRVVTFRYAEAVANLGDDAEVQWG